MSVASDRAKAKEATTRGRRSSSNGRNTKSSSSASARARSSSARTKNSSGRTKNSSGRTKNSSGGSSRSPSTSRSTSKRTQSRSRQTQSSQQRKNGGQGSQQRNHGGGRQVWTNAGISALTAAIGMAGGVALGRSTGHRDRKVLGIPVPEKIDLGGIGQQIGDAGRQFGKLASEVRTVREKAEQVGRILT
jgi:hypothetical protein